MAKEPDLDELGRVRMKTYQHADWLAEAERRFGPKPMRWRFVCPSCDMVQTGNDLKAAGVKSDRLQSYLAFSCVGRFNNGETGCDWTLGGLFQVHRVEVVIDGKVRPCFDFDTVVEEEPADA